MTFQRERFKDASNVKVTDEFQVFLPAVKF